MIGDKINKKVKKIGEPYIVRGGDCKVFYTRVSGKKFTILPLKSRSDKMLQGLAEPIITSHHALIHSQNKEERQKFSVKYEE